MKYFTKGLVSYLFVIITKLSDLKVHIYALVTLLLGLTTEQFIFGVIVLKSHNNLLAYWNSGGLKEH